MSLLWTLLLACAPARSDPATVDGVALRRVPTPGLVLVVVDTLRADAPDQGRLPADPAPFLRGLGERGVVFRQHRANSTWTRPSMATLLTGRWPAEHGAMDVGTRADPALPTVAERLHAAGFATAAFLGNPLAGRISGLDRGWDRFEEPADGRAPPSAAELLGRAARWAAAQPPDRPFFVLVLPFEPHAPYAPPPEAAARFCPDCSPDAVVEPEREYRGEGPTPAQRRDMRALQAAEVRAVDDALGTFQRRLADAGLAGRTTLVLTADHGEAFGEHRVYGHAFHTWEEVLRVPLVVSGAAVAEPGEVSFPTQHVDLAPTLLRLAGLPLPAELPGQPLAFSPRDLPPQPDRVTLAEVDMYGIHRVVALHRGRKLVLHEPLDTARFHRFHDDVGAFPSVSLQRRWDLYDLAADPNERHRLDGEADALRAVIESRARRGSPPVSADHEALRALGYLD